ncbi:hypothetical protein FHT40_003532 [Mycolicibacterium sp. BK556]|nr:MULTISPECIES: hypothetical protein [Mycobacteriaceae]MBB3603871.1 hypothetical protein [Mycolicibacterium sp. BK556]MBB3634066.1 hypothetical protein [Mycolicibacterium sp. BK607]MBB3751647.1 hypothetical protein [Mycolicibacterium sp. BK634]TDO12161.1 hypothetical protein EV580_3887 [Mycobacterium sp. BK086]
MTPEPAEQALPPQSMSPFESRRTTLIVLWSSYLVAAIILILYWVYAA